MTRSLDDDLRDLLTERATIGELEVARLRAFSETLPRLQSRRRGVLAAAAGIVMLLSFGGLLVSNIRLGSSGASPDSRLAVCGVTRDDAVAIIPMTHLRDFEYYLPAARPLEGRPEDMDLPALVIVRRAGATGSGPGDTSAPGINDLCIVVGTGEAPYKRIDLTGVDTTGMVEFIPEPVGTPIADDLAPWADRCGGRGAGILAAVRLGHGTDLASRIMLDPTPPELATDQPAGVIVYDTGHPFPPLGTPPAPGATIGPREPLAGGRHDICVLVGSDPATAERTVHEDIAVRFVVLVESSPASSPSPSPAPTSALPAQIDPAECAAMKFAEDRCLAVVIAGLGRAGLTLADVASISLAEVPPDTTRLGGGHIVAMVTWRLPDGSSGSGEVGCAGIGGQYRLVCTDRPEIRLSSPINGYQDVPCGAVPGGEPGSACATPLPAIDPEAASAAVPLEIATHDYPILGLGPQEILVGRATLPNGILSDARFSLADPFTRAFTVRDGIALVVRPLDPTRPPFDNIYAHGWYSGTEEVEAYLVFDVIAFTPGATLDVRDLIVR